MPVRGAVLEDVGIDGEIGNVRVNGGDIVPLVEVQLIRRYQDTARLTWSLPGHSVRE